MRRPATLAGVTVAALGLSVGVAGIAGASNAGTSKKAVTATTTAAENWSYGRWNGTGAAGTVKSVGAHSFTLTTRDRTTGDKTTGGSTTVTVDVTGATTYRDAAVKSPTLANVTVGERVAAAGKISSDTVAATQVVIGGPRGWGGPGGPNGTGAAGTVKSVGAHNFTLTTRDRTTGDSTTMTVEVSGATTYRDATVKSPTLANVTVGERVAVVGKKSSDTVAATQVMIGGPGGARGWGGPGGPNGTGAAGTVKSVGAHSFTLTTRDNTTMTVDVSGATTYRDATVKSPTLANVTVGERVAAVGKKSSDTVAATQVMIGGPGGAQGWGGPGGPQGWGGSGGGSASTT